MRVVGPLVVYVSAIYKGRVKLRTSPRAGCWAAWKKRHRVTKNVKTSHLNEAE